MAEEQKSEVKSAADYNIDDLFEDAHAAQKKNNFISVSLWGPPESGKTYTALTFPGPIQYVDLDGGLDPNLKYFRGTQIKRIRCISLEDDVENLASATYDGFKVDPINTLKNFDVACTVLQKVRGGTVVIDTISAYNDWLKMLMNARIPKHVSTDGKEYVDQFDWKYVNQKWLWTWEKLKNIQANLVVIAKAKPVYQNREVTDKLEADWRTNTDFQTSIVVEHFKEIHQADNKIVVTRKAKFSKFRGNKLGSTYTEENLTYDRIMEILKQEGQV